MANIRLLLVKQARFLGFILFLAPKNTTETSTGSKWRWQADIWKEKEFRMFLKISAVILSFPWTSCNGRWSVMASQRIFACSRRVGWCEHPRLQAAPFFPSPQAWVYLHQLVPLSSPCSRHFLPTLVGDDCSVSPSLQCRISRPSLLIQPILFLFFLLLLSPLSCTTHSNTHFTPTVHLSGSPPDLPLSFPHHILTSLFIWSGKMRCLHLHWAVLSSDRKWNLGFLPHKTVVEITSLTTTFLGIRQCSSRSPWTLLKIIHFSSPISWNNVPFNST